MDNPFNGQVDIAIYEIYLNKKKTAKKSQNSGLFYVNDRAVIIKGFTTHAVTTSSFNTKEGKTLLTQEYLDEYCLPKNEFTERLVVLADGLTETLNRNNGIYTGNSNLLRDQLRNMKIRMIESIFKEVKRYGTIELKNPVLSDCNSNIDCLPTEDDYYKDHTYSLYYDQEKKAVFSKISGGGMEEVEDIYFVTLKQLNLLKKNKEIPNGDCFDFTEEIAKLYDEVYRSIGIKETVESII
jgi:hypothetical protein